ncbi:MAG: NrfD/PsrC family molybdoenzyme membrane anchor subunit [Gammaproteobacteria bacterium]|nr:NrfD/PsrC family molybdoenzyme membrane anchor subunit [Gammaproteobacteria bacterium]
MDPTLVYNIQSGTIWDWRVAVDLFAGGVGVGALLFSVALSRYGDARYRRLAQTAGVIAPFLVMLGLLFLFWKVGNKFNVYQMGINLAPTSLMWWGFLIQSALVAFGLLYAWMWLKPEANPGRSGVGLVAAFFAILVGIYHGMLLAVLTSHPVWASGSMVLLAVLAFASTGVAGGVLAHQLRMMFAGRADEEDELDVYVRGLKPVAGFLAAVLVLMLLNFFAWWVDLAFGSLQSRQALDAAMGVHGTLFILVGLGIGVVLPLALVALWYSRVRAGSPGAALSLMGVASLLVLVGGFVIRYSVVLGGQVALPIATLS